MPSTVLAIDPGIDAGWALFVEGRLTDCGMGNLPEPSTLPPVCLVIAERPHIHRGTRNPDDIVTLAEGVHASDVVLAAYASVASGQREPVTAQA